MSWLSDHLSEIFGYAVSHAWLAGAPLVIGLLIGLPLGWLALKNPLVRGVVLTSTGLLYTIPSLALFVTLPVILGTQILDPINVLVAMTLYTVALLTRTAYDALGSVDPVTTQAAIAVGFTPVARVLKVELPLAVPVLAAGLRVAAVSNVSIVSVAALIGVPQLGYYFTDGNARSFPLEIWTGIIACLLLALIFDLVIVAIARVLTPWRQAVRA